MLGQLFNVLFLRNIKLMSYKFLRSRTIKIAAMPTPKRNRTDDDSPEKNEVLRSLAQLDAKIDEKFNMKFDEMISKMNNGFAQMSSDMTKNFDSIHQHLKKHDDQISVLQKKLDRNQKENELIVVPYAQNENISTIITNIAAAIQCGNEVDLRKVEAFRMGQSRSTEGHSAPILLKFSCKFDRKIFYRRYMAKRTLCLLDIGYSANNRVYVNKNLTTYDRKIFKALLGLKKRKIVASVFSLDGVVCYAKEKKDRLQMMDAISDVLNNDYLKTNLSEEELRELTS